MRQRGLRADESYSPVLVVGGVSAGGGGAVVGARRARGRGATGGAAAGAGAAGTTAAGPFIRSAGSRLTFETVVAAGPTAGAMLVPTVILRASGLPVLSTGAVAFAGTV